MISQLPWGTRLGAVGVPLGLLLLLVGALPGDGSLRVVAGIGAATTALSLLGIVAVRTARGAAEAIDFAHLGYAVFGFGDAAKFLLTSGSVRQLRPETESQVIYLLVLSFVTYFVFAGGLRRNPDVARPDFGPVHDEQAPKIVLILRILFVAGPAYWLLVWRGGGGLADLVGAPLKASVIVLAYWGFSRRRRDYLVLAGLVALVALPDTSRRAYIVTLLPLLVLLVDGEMAKSAARRRWVYAAGLALFVLLNALRARHDFGEGFNPDDPVGNTLNYMSTLRSLDTFYNTGFVVENMPRPFAFRMGDTYLAVAVALIPRSIWPSKPVGFGAPLGLMQVKGVPDFDPELWVSINRYSLSPGFVGEAFANFGVIGVLGMAAILGVAVRFVAAASRRTSEARRWTLETLWVLPVFSSLTLLGRGDFYVAVNYSITVALSLAVIARYAR